MATKNVQLKKMTSAPVAILVRAVIFGRTFFVAASSCVGVSYVLKQKQGVIFMKPELAEVAGFSSFF
jgi:hypothetical protein